MARDFAKAFYKSSKWKKIREVVLIRDKYKCCICGSSQNLEVHHIEHLSPDNIDFGDIAIDTNNLKTLCRDCHFKQHELDRLKGNSSKDCEDGFRFDENGYLIIDTPPIS